MEEKKGSFWTALPNVLARCAAVITAIGGLIAVLYAAGIMPNQPPESDTSMTPPVASTLPPAVTPALTPLEISQTQGRASAWFGDSPAYVNVGQGQSFILRRPAILNTFEIYLTSDTSTAHTDEIICDLRNAAMVVLESSSIEGFSTGGGWKSFAFNTMLGPGMYIFTCYLHNPTPQQHHYSIHGNVNDNSYLDGTRYVSTGGYPEDGSTWKPGSWDLKFRIRMDVVE